MLKADDFLIREMIVRGVIGPKDVERAKAEGEGEGAESSVVELLVSNGVITGRDVAMIRALVSEVPFVDLEHYDIDIRNASLLSKALAEAHDAFPLFEMECGVVVGMADPLNFRGLDQIRQRIGRDVEAVLCEPEALRTLILRAYRHGFAKEATEEESDPAGRAMASDPVVATVEDSIGSAIDAHASDIHLGPDEMEVHLRFRIDGVLQSRTAPPKSMHAALVRRLKVLAGLDLTQSRRPQDGKFKFAHRGEVFDIRLSVIPTIWGENAVLRILRHASEIKTFDALGMDEELVREVEAAITRPHGMILVTGPTGSGKTTTLYTALARLNTPERNIMTIEDPVEIRLPLVRQTQVSNEAGLTFATALRTILRQDPDVVLVGEIRDEETAHIATQAALTGHLMLSTLHTNDAAGAVARLRDFKVPAYVVSSALIGVLSQRLVRGVCAQCAVPDRLTPDELEVFGLTPAEGERLRRGEGCPVCAHTGFKGRVGIYEWLRVSPTVQSLIAQEATPVRIAEAAVREGMRLMWRDGLSKVLAGRTTLREVSRIRAEDQGGSRRALEAAA